LPKVLSAYSLSPQQGERAKVRGKKKFLPTNISVLGFSRNRQAAARLVCLFF
jgi:hypothetical protein